MQNFGGGDILKLTCQNESLQQIVMILVLE